MVVSISQTPIAKVASVRVDNNNSNNNSNHRRINNNIISDNNNNNKTKKKMQLRVKKKWNTVMSKTIFISRLHRLKKNVNDQTLRAHHRRLFRQHNNNDNNINLKYNETLHHHLLRIQLTTLHLHLLQNAVVVIITTALL